jgi:hypothetical protein
MIESYNNFLVEANLNKSFKKLLRNIKSHFGSEDLLFLYYLHHFLV